MPLSSEHGTLGAGLLVVGEFLCLAVLGYLLLQLIAIENWLENNRAQALLSLRQQASQLRALRLRLADVELSWPSLDFGPLAQPKWRVARWLAKTLFAAGMARS